MFWHFGEGNGEGGGGSISSWGPAPTTHAGCSQAVRANHLTLTFWLGLAGLASWGVGGWGPFKFRFSKNDLF